jgi:hypothetical protein
MFVLLRVGLYIMSVYVPDDGMALIPKDITLAYYGMGMVCNFTALFVRHLIADIKAYL